KPGFFYGWYIVGVGFLANVASTFALASTLSVFLKPLTEDLGVSRGVFSLLRSGESLIGAGLAPMVGSLVDRQGGRLLMTFGALVVGAGFIVLSQVDEFWQFALVRWSLVSVGDAFMGSMVINVTLARWFIRRRGRAIALSSMGIGFGKVGMPIFAASLLVWLGWRLTWGAFGLLTLALVVGPAFTYMRRRPEDMGLHPDGISNPFSETLSSEKKRPGTSGQAVLEEVIWSRREVVRNPTFWFMVLTFGIASVGVTGLNLHVFSYVTDMGHPAVVAATVMSVIAFMQLVSPLFWGLLSERIDIRKAAMLQFLIQATGLSLAITTNHLMPLYSGFFLYGIGLGGSMVLPDIIWASYFGRLSLGTVRGLGLLLTHSFAAVGPPFFGFLFDASGSYLLSFSLFIMALVSSAFLCLFFRPPQK
ncbi:MAG: MFS transporter, partial [Candidatus Binatota bacterium]